MANIIIYIYTYFRVFVETVSATKWPPQKSVGFKRQTNSKCGFCHQIQTTKLYETGGNETNIKNILKGLVFK